MRLPGFVDTWMARMGYSRAVSRVQALDATPRSSKKAVFKPLFVKFKQVFNSRNAKLEEQEFDFISIRKAMNVESILRQAKEKFIQLMWKNGFSFVGKNPKAVEHVRLRLAQIALVTQTPVSVLLDNIAEEMVTYNNVFIVMQRDVAASGGKPYVNLFGKSVNPVAGMFLIPTSHVQPITDGKTGRLLAWKVSGFKDQDDQYYLKDDVVHMHMSRAVGNITGTPAVVPVLDDIRALRKMEEAAETLVFQHSIPLFEYKVGTEESPEQDPEKFDEIKAQIEGTAPTGMFVIPSDHSVKAVGLGESPLDVSKYLSYFRLRVISGLGLSTVVFGESDSSNRGTAQVQDKGLQDGAKKYLTSIKTYFDEMIINEILREGGFDIMNPEDQVHLFTPEIDMDAKTKLETHVMALYQGHCITENEMRNLLGLEAVPESERSLMYLNLVEIPRAEAGAAEPAGAGGGTGLKIPAKTAVKTRPVNQQGPKINSKPAVNNSLDMHLATASIKVATTMRTHFDGMMGAMIRELPALQAPVDQAGLVAKTIETLTQDTQRALTEVFDQGQSASDSETAGNQALLEPILSQNAEFLHELGRDATILLERLQKEKLVPVSGQEPPVFTNTITPGDVITIFDTLRYRLTKAMPGVIKQCFDAGVGAGKEERTDE